MLGWGFFCFVFRLRCVVRVSVCIRSSDSRRDISICAMRVFIEQTTDHSLHPPPFAAYRNPSPRCRKRSDRPHCCISTSRPQRRRCHRHRLHRRRHCQPAPGHSSTVTTSTITPAPAATHSTQTCTATSTTCSNSISSSSLARRNDVVPAAAISSSTIRSDRIDVEPRAASRRRRRRRRRRHRSHFTCVVGTSGPIDVYDDALL